MPQRVDIWRLALGRHADGTLLSPAELDRAARMRPGPAREGFVDTRVALRQILAAYLGLAPSQVPLAERAGGKPVLDAAAGCADWRFNLSHTRDLALCAVALGCEVGVDVEWIDPALAWQPIAAAQFPAHEQAALLALPERAQRTAFFSAWTRKEARLKGLGTGFAVAVHEVQSPPGPWAVMNLDVGPGYAAALAVQGEAPPELRLRPWPKQSAA